MAGGVKGSVRRGGIGVSHRGLPFVHGVSHPLPCFICAVRYTVRFRRGVGYGQVEMVLNIMLRPMTGFEKFVRMFTETIVPVLVRNLKVNLEEGSDKRRVNGDYGWVVRSDS